MMTLPTIEELGQMSELGFEFAMVTIEQEARCGDEDAKRLITHIDAVIAQAGGTFDLDFLPRCRFGFAHTRHWCGNAGCRDA